jgi:hypothetical protein
MLNSIEKLIELENRLLHKPSDREAKPEYSKKSPAFFAGPAWRTSFSGNHALRSDADRGDQWRQ